MKPKVFLSHSSIDVQRVRQIKKLLEERDIECWWDEERIFIGESIVEEIENALKSCDFVIFFISKYSIESNWVKREIYSTLSRQIKDKKPKILPAKLDNIQTPNILNDVLWADLSNSTSTEGVDVLANSIKSQFAVSEPEIGDYENNLLDDVSRLLRIKVEQKGFHWFIISGPSSAGKDVLAHVLDQRLNIRYGTEQGIKYTTRERRNSEPPYVRQLSRQEFEEMRNNGKLIFPYFKRHEEYGFDYSQLSHCIRVGKPLISVYTHLTQVPKIAESMNEQGFLVTPIFIEVRREALFRRVFFRNLDGPEVKRRIQSIEQDLNEMNSRNTFRSEYNFINNDDSQSFSMAADEITNLIESCLSTQNELT